MAASRKIVLHSRRGYRPELDFLVKTWIRDGVEYIGIVGVDAGRIEDAIDDLCVGDGTESYFILTTSHGPDETLDDAVFLANQLSDPDGPVSVVEF